MKVIGDKNIFAIEFRLEYVDTKNFYGNIWFWINNTKVGAMDKESYLSSSVRFLKDFLIFTDVRRIWQSELMNAEEVFWNICVQFNRGYEEKNRLYLKEEIYNQIFRLETVGDANFFDEVKIMLINEPEKNRQRFILRKYVDEKIEEYFIPYGYFEEVAQNYINELENEVAIWNKS